MTGIAEHQSVKPVQTFDSVKRRSTKYAVYFDLKKNSICSRWDTKSDVTKLHLPNNLLRFMAKEYRLDKTGRELKCFAECCIPYHRGSNTVVRCHPNYQSKGPWNDWGMIRFQGKLRPAKFHALVDLGGEKMDAIAQIAAGDATISGSVLITSWKFPLSNDAFYGKSYHRVNMRNYVRPSLVFHKKTSQEVLVVTSFENWHQKF